jgi:YHS domain-containing protein
VTDAIDTIWEGIQQSFLMAYEVWWALVLGLAISAVVQAWVPRERVQSALAGSGFRPLARATGLGAASSSCSYATDPVCGTKVDRTKALRLQHAGHTCYFGSERCLSRFEADPDAYTGVGATPAPAHAGHAH